MNLGLPEILMLLVMLLVMVGAVAGTVFFVLWLIMRRRK